MPPRRESRTSQRRSTGIPSRGGWVLPFGLSLPSLPRPTPQGLGRLALLILGAVAGSGLLGQIWREPDRAALDQVSLSPASLAEKPSRPITVLVIGLDADKPGDGPNQAAPAGQPNADALMLVRVNPKGPLQVLNLPIELAVTIPGEAQPVALGSVYQRGGVALTGDVVRELVGLEPPRPDRYLVLSRSALRTIVDTAGGLEISPPRVMRYQDKAQKYTIDLQSGLQRLDGKQVEQLVRFRDPDFGESARRRDHQLVETGLRERFARPEQLARLPDLLSTLQGQVETDLTGRESLSLLAAALDDRRPIQYTILPIKPPPEPLESQEDIPKEKEQKLAEQAAAALRQLDSPPGKPLWPAPKGP